MWSPGVDIARLEYKAHDLFLEGRDLDFQIDFTSYLTTRKFATANYGLLYTAKGMASLLILAGNHLQAETKSWVLVFAVMIAFDWLAALLAWRFSFSSPRPCWRRCAACSWIVSIAAACSSRSMA